MVQRPAPSPGINTSPAPSGWSPTAETCPAQLYSKTYLNMCHCRWLLKQSWMQRWRAGGQMNCKPLGTSLSATAVRQEMQRWLTSAAWCDVGWRQWNMATSYSILKMLVGTQDMQINGWWIDHIALLCFCDRSMDQVVQGQVVLEGPLLAVGNVSDNNRHVNCGPASMGLILMLQ